MADYVEAAHCSTDEQSGALVFQTPMPEDREVVVMTGAKPVRVVDVFCGIGGGAFGLLGYGVPEEMVEGRATRPIRFVAAVDSDGRRAALYAKNVGLASGQKMQW